MVSVKIGDWGVLFKDMVIVALFIGISPIEEVTFIVRFPV